MTDALPEEWRGATAARVSPRVWKLTTPDGRLVALKVAAPGAPLDVEAQALDWLSRHGCPVPRVVATSGGRPLDWLACEWCGDDTLADLQPAGAPERFETVGLQLAGAQAAIEAAFGRLAGNSSGPSALQAAALREQVAPWIAAAPAALNWLLGQPLPAGVVAALERALAAATEGEPTLGTLDYNPRNVVIARRSNDRSPRSADEGRTTKDESSFVVRPSSFVPTGHSQAGALGDDRLWIVDFAAVGADWPERRFVQYGTITGADQADGTFASVVGRAAVRRYAEAMAPLRGREPAAAAHDVDAHDVLLLLTAATQLRLVEQGAAHLDRAAAWTNLPARRQRLVALLARRLCDGGPAEELRALIR